MTFRNDEKRRYKSIKPKLFSLEAQELGIYKKKHRSFCLADNCSVENLHKSIRDEAIAYFKARRIPWHEGFSDVYGNKKTLPSNHLCCSQCMCVNCLAPMMRDKNLLQKVFKSFLPEIEEVSPFKADKLLCDGSQPYLSFEFVGEKTHFDGEKGWPQRGANCTSVDFSFLFKRYDGRSQLVLGEWKYTEEYRGRRLPSKCAVNRTQWETYKEEFEMWRQEKPKLPSYEAFFVEPFYQLMRQTLLAKKMERERELGADIVLHVHISPKANRELSDVFTSPIFKEYGQTITEAWGKIAPRDRFAAISSEELLTNINEVSKDGHRPWADWILQRYGWWRY